MARFSVIIPAYNSLRTIPATLESLLSECHRDFIHEIIVADSSDDPSAIEYLEHEEMRGHIKLVRVGIRTMPAIARNAGARHATSPYLVFVDSDVVVTDQWSSGIAEFFSKGFKAGGGSVSLPLRQRNKLLPLSQLYLEFSDYIDAMPQRVKPFVSSCNMFCTKDVFDQVGGFPPIRASEDVMFCLKLSQVTDLIFLPEVNVHHIFREKLAHFAKNQILIGKYVNIYRRALKPEAYYLTGPGTLLCSPAIPVVKFLRIASKIIRVNNTHRKAFILSLPVFFLGLLFWSYGFITGAYYAETP